MFGTFKLKITMLCQFHKICPVEMQNQVGGNKIQFI